MNRSDHHDVLEVDHLTNLPFGMYQRWTLCKHVVLKTTFDMLARPNKFIRETVWSEYVDYGDCQTCKATERRAAAAAAGNHLKEQTAVHNELIVTTLNKRCMHVSYREGAVTNLNPGIINSLNLISADNNPGWCVWCALDNRYPRRQAPEIGPFDAAEEKASAQPGDILYSPPRLSRSPSPAVSENTIDADHDESMEDVNTNAGSGSDNDLADDQAAPESDDTPTVVNGDGDHDAGVEQNAAEEGGVEEEEDEDGDYYTIGSGTTGVRDGFTYPVWGLDGQGQWGERWFCQAPGCRSSYSKYHDMVAVHRREHSDIDLPFPMAKKPNREAALARDATRRANNEGGVAI